MTMAQRSAARNRNINALDEFHEGYDDDDDELMLKWERMDVQALMLGTVTSFVKHRPIFVSFWVLGLLLAASAGGLPVGSEAAEAYQLMRQHAEVIDVRELGQALERLQQEEDGYYRARGWFGSCDSDCERARDKVALARTEAVRLQEQRDKVLAEARHEVGIWSSFGVQDVRDSFWSAWTSGKEFATRWTMMDMLFMGIGGREETLVTVALRVVVRYVVNLTMGMIGAFFFFVYNVYCLVASYGESALSGLAFLLLAFVAGLATVSAYLTAVYGLVAGGGLMLMQRAAMQAVANGSAKEQGRLQYAPRSNV